MTREEAIYELKNAAWLGTDHSRARTEEAVEMAIKALSQEPCDDAVSRILKRMWNCRGKHTTSIDKVAMEQIIRDELPSVTQKSGKWIRKYDRIVNELYWECNKCGEGFQLTSNFCPNCGAKMESEEQTE